jgi:2-aminomuconate deaminase
MINSDKAPEPLGVYPHARKVGNLLFLSGIGPRKRGSSEVAGRVLDKDGKLVSYDIEQQCHAVFKNVLSVLEASGAKWGDLVDVIVFLPNLEKDFQTYNRLYEEYFKEIQPCRTTIGCNSLPGQIAIELKCIAVLS